jgi:tricorn protease-like protein
MIRKARRLKIRLNSREFGLLFTLCLSGLLIGCVLGNSPDPSATFGSAQSPADTQTLLPDLVIQSVSIVGDSISDCPSPYQKFSSRVRIKNKGEGPAGPFIVRLNLDQQLIAKGLQSGENVELVFPDYVSSVKALVDATSLVVEQDETNNQVIQIFSRPTIAPRCLATATPEIIQVEAAQVLEGHTAKVWDVQFSPDGKTLASGSVDDTVRLWGVHPAGLVRTMEGHPFPILKIVYTPNGSTLFTGSTDGIVRAWDVASGELINTLSGHTGWITALAISNDAKWLASSAEDSTIRLWRLPSASAVQIIDEGMTGVNCVAFSPDSSAIAWGEVDGTLRARTITGDWLYTVKSSYQSVTSLTFSEDGKMLITGYRDGFIRVWNAKDGTSIQTIFAHTAAVTDLAMSSDGKWLVSSSDDHTLRLWKYDLDQFVMLPTRIFAGHTGPVTSLALAKDQPLIASSSEDGTIRFWNFP